MICFCFLYNVCEDVTVIGGKAQTPYEARFGQFKDKDILQFGCEVEYLPSNPVYVEKQHTSGAKTRSGIFMGYAQYKGGEWSGDVWIADWELMEKATHPTYIKPTKIPRAQVEIPKLSNGHFRFPIAEGALTLNYTKHEFANLDNTHKEFRTASRIAKDSSKEIPAHLRVSPREPSNDEAAEESTVLEFAEERQKIPEIEQTDFWSMPNNDMIIRTHVTPRTSLFVPTSENCPVPIEWLDIIRETHTDLDHPKLQQIEDYWTVDKRSGKARDLEEEWIGKAKFFLLHPQPKAGYEYQSGRLTKIKQTTRPPTVWPETWKD